jgi:hypothetical protein
MNEIEKGQLCDITMSAIHYGCSKLDSIPAYLRRIIENRAWECRQVKMRGVVQLANLRELITKEPMEGWGENPERIEGLIKHDAEVLVLWRDAMKEKTGPKLKGDDGLCNIVTETKGTTGNSRSYTVSRLQREAPELFAQVVAGTLSANAAAIQAGFRKKPTALEMLLKAWKVATDDDRRLFLLEINK